MRLLLAAEAAALLRLSENRVYELAKRRLIPCVRIGRQIRFPEDKLIAWIEAGGCPLEAPCRPAMKVVDSSRRSAERG
jgi:excisionase family DNA binding protein